MPVGQCHTEDTAISLLESSSVSVSFISGIKAIVPCNWFHVACDQLLETIFFGECTSQGLWDVNVTFILEKHVVQL